MEDNVDTEDEFQGNEPAEAFGSSIALSDDGNTLAIGAPQARDKRGRVKVLEYDGSSWTPHGSSIFGEPGDDFGSSVALSSDGKRVLGGAPSATFDGSIAQAGMARVYDRMEF
jgi:hypothetical protein